QLPDLPPSAVPEVENPFENPTPDPPLRTRRQVAPAPTAEIGPNPFETGGATQPQVENVIDAPASVRIRATGPSQGMNISGRQATPYVKTYESQTPSMTVDWVTPEVVSVGQEGNFELVLRNRGQVAINDVVIEQALPKGFQLIEAKPKPVQLENQPVWMIANLEPNEEHRIALRLKPVVAGEAHSHARVTFSTSSSTKFRVVEPIIKLVADGPESVILGNQAVFNVVVDNPGTAPAMNTILKIVLPEGLVPVAKSTTYEIGTLNPGESRSIRVLANMVKLGDHVCRFEVTADNNLKDAKEHSVQGLGAILETKIDGPRFRYVGRPATFTIVAENQGTAEATNVHVRCAVPQSFGFMEANLGGKYDAASKTVNWFVNKIPAKSKVTVECELKALDRGEFPVLALSYADRGLRSLAKHETAVEGIAAILLEVVDIDDPVEVGTETGYEILITNQGTDFATNIQVKLDVPDGMEITGIKGPSKGIIENRTVRFEPLAKLAPRADAIYRVKIRGTKPGDFRVTVQAQSDTLKSPVTEQESTKVYQD
ncbi:MAG: DUF11 domain-containing protein, partial [Planctomycetaceae bacterium]|nr:DUF11 domain-containing protein [Planctomycetaceae bacterium]